MFISPEASASATDVVAIHHGWKGYNGNNTIYMTKGVTSNWEYNGPNVTIERMANDTNTLSSPYNHANTNLISIAIGKG